MNVVSDICRGLWSAICAFSLMSVTGCGTDAKGVDECRDIEETRCTAAQRCQPIDVDACKRFYHDQCLHGLGVSSPGSTAVNACVATIRAAGQCAAQAASGDVRLRDCDPPITEQGSAQTACELVNEPQAAAECAFLAPASDAGGGSAGSNGVAGSSGAAGTVDSAGAGGD